MAAACGPGCADRRRGEAPEQEQRLDPSFGGLLCGPFAGQSNSNAWGGPSTRWDPSGGTHDSMTVLQIYLYLATRRCVQARMQAILFSQDPLSILTLATFCFSLFQRPVPRYAFTPPPLPAAWDSPPLLILNPPSPPQLSPPLPSLFLQPGVPSSWALTPPTPWQGCSRAGRY